MRRLSTGSRRQRITDDDITGAVIEGIPDMAENQLRLRVSSDGELQSRQACQQVEEAGSFHFRAVASVSASRTRCILDSR